MARNQRIAASGFFGLLTLALCLLWLRSNFYGDLFRGPNLGDKVLMLGSRHGLVSITLANPYHSWPLSPRHYSQPLASRQSAFPVRFTARMPQIVFPMWAIALPSSLAATMPWASSVWAMRSQRFSLRSLLIATTLAAVVLGLAVWAAR